MLAYSLEEAEQLLSSKLSAARSSLANCEDDLDFLREQITVSGSTRCPFFSLPPFRMSEVSPTDPQPRHARAREQTMEVATARVYNWDVGMRRKETAQGVGDDDDSEKDAKASDG